MHAILFRAVARHGNRDEVLDFLKRDADESSSERGTLRFDVMQDPENDHAFYVYECYVSRESFEQEHQQGRAFQEWKTRVQPELAAFCILFQGPPAAVLAKRPS
jgi:autoinducer 2-degrading protein